mgnify:CR=1 FL=1
MKIVLLAALVSFVLTLILGRFVLAELRKLKAGQEIRQDGPTWHNAKAGTPTMGGIMFILGAGVTVLVLGWQSMLAGDVTHLYVYLFALVFGLIGFVDDFRKVKQHQNEGLTAKQKFVLQLLAAVIFLSLMRYEGLLSNDLYLPFFNVSFTINWIVYLVFAAFVIVGCVNAVNLTDGIDGLATGVTLPVMLFFTFVSMTAKQWGLATFPATLVGALGGFLFYNFYPAKTFMGDTGSLYLGGAVCGLAYALDMPLVLLFVGLIYIIETLSDILQVSYFKLTHGKRIFKMAPIHHHFEMCGWSEKKIWVVFVSVTVIMCVIAWFGVRIWF